MDIVKQAQGGQTVAVTEEQLEQINRFARRELKGPGGPDLCRRGGAGGEAHPDRGALLLVEGVRLYGAHRGQRGPDP